MRAGTRAQDSRSATMASNNPPVRQGCWVMSNTAQSRILPETPYCSALRMMPVLGRAPVLDLDGSAMRRYARAGGQR